MKYLLILLLSFLLVNCSNKGSANQKQLNRSFFSQSNPPKGMVHIPGGSFQMGDIYHKRKYGEYAVHYVRVSSFFMDTTEVTEIAYRRVLGLDTSNVENPYFPLQKFSWSSAIAFCNTRSQKEGFEQVYKIEQNGDVSANFSAKGYRLPTEAEWEYACRAGTTTAFYWGDDPHLAQAYEWSETDKEQAIHAVATKKPNAFHLYDMLGNVSEWCWDWYKDSRDPIDSINPTGPLDGREKVLRGGNFQELLTSCSRRSGSTNEQIAGFRCVVSAPDSSESAKK